MSDIWGSVDDVVEGTRVAGWAAPAGPETTEPVDVVAKLNGVSIGRGPARYHRDDLSHVREGKVAFSFTLDRKVSTRDILTGQFRLVGAIGGVECGSLPFGRYFLRSIGIDHIKAGLRHLETATRLLEQDEVAEMLESGQTPVPPELAPALMPWFRELYRNDFERVSYHLNADRSGVLAHVARPVLSRFESLGANCEFGLVQRHFGVESIGLLRWGASIGLLPGVIDAIRQRFMGVGQSVSLRQVNEEYISHEDKYRLVFHTDRFIGRDDPELLLRNERARIPFLARQLVEDLEDGHKMFVYKAVFDPNLSEVLALSDAMREIGPAPLLWVTLAETAAQIGSAEMIRPNLFRGYIDRFSPPANIYDYCSYKVWVAICHNALRLWDDPP